MGNAFVGTTITKVTFDYINKELDDSTDTPSYLEGCTKCMPKCLCEYTACSCLWCIVPFIIIAMPFTLTTWPTTLTIWLL